VPQARFIHIHRDPRHVANSLLHKQRGGPIEDGIRVWEQYVGEVIEFFEEIPADLVLTVSYRAVIEDPVTTAASIGSCSTCRMRHRSVPSFCLNAVPQRRSVIL
jgi:hypothetical protein